jgi:hypothetical protein
MAVQPFFVCPRRRLVIHDPVSQVMKVLSPVLSPVPGNTLLEIQPSHHNKLKRRVDNTFLALYFFRQCPFRIDHSSLIQVHVGRYPSATLWSKRSNEE